jgi:hypothetical protein
MIMAATYAKEKRNRIKALRKDGLGKSGYSIKPLWQA